MKLTRFQLIHATDKQLAVIGLVRRRNSGWLKKALAKGTDHPAEKIAAFIAADVRRAPKPTQKAFTDETLRPDMGIPISEESPEDFANALYLRCGGNLE